MIYVGFFQHAHRKEGFVFYFYIKFKYDILLYFFIHFKPFYIQSNGAAI